MTDYIFRLMLEEDLSEVVDLVISASDYPWSPQNIRESLFSNHDKAFVLCALSGLEILAYAVIHKVLDESHLLNIVIKKEEQGRGLGSYFLKQLIKFVKDKNQHSLLLEVRVSNAIAIKLYESIGFQLDGTRKDYYPKASGREDARLYSLSFV